MEIQKKISLKKYKKIISQKRVVLVEDPLRERGILKERLKHKPRDRWLRFLDRRVPRNPRPSERSGAIKRSTIPESSALYGESFHGKARPGNWVEARITQALPYDLVAQIEKILP